MDQSGIQSKVSRGYATAARFLGATFNQFRPIDPAHPLANQVSTVQAAFDIDAAFSFSRPAKPGLALYYALADFTAVQPGDYLRRAGTADLTEIYFFAGSEPIKPPQCIRCNRLLTLIRPGETARVPGQVTDAGYAGANTGHDTTLLTGWPASVIEGTKGNSGPVNLPEDTRMGWIKASLPALPGGIEPRSSDILTDDLGRRFTISAAEQAWTGWRLSAELTVA